MDRQDTVDDDILPTPRGYGNGHRANTGGIRR